MSYVPEIWDGQLTMTKISLLENQQKAATNPPTRWKDGQQKLTDWHRSLMARHTIEWCSPPIWSIYWGNPSWYLTIQLIWKIESGNQGFRPQALDRAIKHNFFLIHVIIKMEKSLNKNLSHQSGWNNLEQLRHQWQFLQKVEPFGKIWGDPAIISSPLHWLTIGRADNLKGNQLHVDRTDNL